MNTHDFRSFAPEHRVNAGLQFFDGKEFIRRTGHDEGERIFRHISRQAAKDLFPAFIGEEQFPADAAVAIQDGRRRRVIFNPLPLPLMNVPRPTCP